MDVILLERIEKLGQMGDVVSVKPGYARNFLLPQGKALRATAANRTHFDSQKAQLEADNLKRRDEAVAVAAKMDNVSVIMVRQAGESGQLYGSVNTRDIAEAVTEAGFTVNRQQVRLERPIKTLGPFEVEVRLHPEVAESVTVNVARSVEEAEIQASTGKALISTEEEEEQAPAIETLVEDTVEAEAETDAVADAVAEAEADAEAEATQDKADD